jgi:hypothetical protein
MAASPGGWWVINYLHRPVMSFGKSLLFNRSIKNYIPPFGLQSDHHPDEILELLLRQHMTYGLRGVHILCAPADARKPTAAYKVANELIDEKKLYGAIYHKDNEKYKTFAEWYASRIPLDRKLSLALPDFCIKSPLLLLVDHCDTLTTTECKSRIINLAQESTDTKKFVVFLICRDHSTATTIKGWNGGKKIQIIGEV